MEQSASDYTGTIERELTIAVTSAMNVTSTSWLRFLDVSFVMMDSRIRHLTPIVRSQTPPMCEECGGLKIHVEPLLYRKSFTGLSSTLTLSIFKPSVEPIKLVPRSDQNSVTLPLIAMKRRSALIKDDVLSYSMTSICMALELRQVKRIDQRLLLAWPPLVRRAITDHGPKASTPTFVNGGPGSRRSAGRSDIVWNSCLPRSLRHFTHRWIREKISRFPPITQNPAALTAPSVKCGP